MKNERALVLGGGGPVGIAWETGFLAGLLESGVDVRSADLVVGTSAGSVVGAQIASGIDARSLVEAQARAAAGGPGPAQFDLSGFLHVLQRWMQIEEMTAAFRAEMGAISLAARTMPEEAWLGVIGALVQGLDWPARRLVVTSVDTANGDFKTWDAHAGAPLRLAVAASCAVPGIFPPVTIDGRRYMDGGMRSGTNADLAEGHGAVLVVAPISAQMMGAIARSQARELSALQAAGARVAWIEPDAEALEAFGPNLMDTSRGPVVAAAGTRQGKAAAARVAALWG